MKEQVDMTDGFVKAEECPFGCKDDYSPIVEESLGELGKIHPHWRVCCCNGCSGPVSYESRDDAIARWNRVAQMRRALDTVLLFYNAGHWKPEHKAAWKATTGEDAATTRVLCDYLRKVLS